MRDDICYWKPTIANHDKVHPFLIVDNWFSNKELRSVWKELDFLSSRNDLERAEDNDDVAKKKDGSSKAKAFRIFYDEIYNDTGRLHSHLPLTLDKIRKKEFGDLLEKAMPLQSRTFFTTSKSNCLITYYENNDGYETHHDNAIATILIWLYKEPKKYEGGDLLFTDFDTRIKNKNNRLLIFPSYYNHEVEPVKMLEPQTEMGYGRFTITHFFNS